MSDGYPARREAYLARTSQRGASAPTLQMGLFQQPVRANVRSMIPLDPSTSGRGPFGVRGREIGATMIAVAARRNTPAGKRGMTARAGDLHPLSVFAVGFRQFSSRSRP